MPRASLQTPHGSLRKGPVTIVVVSRRFRIILHPAFSWYCALFESHRGDRGAGGWSPSEEPINCRPRLYFESSFNLGAVVGGRATDVLTSIPQRPLYEIHDAARLMCPCFRCQGDKEEVRAGTYRRRGIPLALFLNLAPHSCQALLKRQTSPELPHPCSPSFAWRPRMPRSHRYSQERLIRNGDDRRTIRKTS